MFGKKELRSENEHLRCLLSDERERNQQLQDQILAMVGQPVIPVGEPQPARVGYVDDERLLELQEEGRAKT